ncbi:hypothetical protein ACHAXA_008068 [Cyclostephanos tholiformis]|uniref:CWF21 domain-containing protein n=1 Tax=Cyclostephanos tholiformis TaxID=382380 RepID=A0ABD3RKM4_9STRA
MAELREQIKVEREREEFDRLTKGDAVGDRGTNWMYEGGGAVIGGIGGSAASTAAREEEEARRNEAYLLGKEYVPEGKARHSGDFVEASTMTGALEKASTYGATIGVGYGNNNTDASGVGTTKLRIREDPTTTSHAAASADGVADAKINIDGEDKGWSQNFHLRHEDPMFAVHQRRQAQLKDAEKKKRLLERAGLDVSAVARQNDNADDGKEEVSGCEKRKRRSKSEKKNRRRIKVEKKHRGCHSKSRVDERKRRKHNPDDDDKSFSSSSSYSSSSAFMSSRRRRRHRDSKKRQQSYSPKYDRRKQAEADEYNDGRRDRHSSDTGERKNSSDRSGSRRKMSGGADDDYHRDRRTMTDCNEKKGQPGLGGYHDSRDRSDKGGRDDERRASSSPPSPFRTFNEDGETRGPITGETRRRYGLIGTSLSNNDKNRGTSTQRQLRGDHHDNYLGPDRSLLESKRRAEAEERERLRKLSRKRS